MCVTVCVAVAALALVALSAPLNATAKKKRGHNHKSQGPAVVFSDNGVNPDATSIWGEVGCQNQSRAQVISTGGDTHPTITGAPQGDSSFRRLSVIDGDDFYGERCELGQDFRSGPTVLYRPGKHRITELSVRLPSTFPLNVFTWQVVMQMKQVWPMSNSGGTPVLELDAYNGRWVLRQSLSPGAAPADGRVLWSVPAQANFWTRFSFDVRYSDSKKGGYLRIGVDLNGDGDFADPSELSRGMHTYTLKREIPGPEHDGIKAGQAIPSHLRAGIYHDTAIPCRGPVGCQVDLDNVQVLRP
jgi:Polysaccharide lyase